MKTVRAFLLPWFVGLFVTVLIAPPARADACVDCMAQIVRMKPCELDALYSASCAGKLPHGFVPGRAIFCAGGRMTVLLSRCTRPLWHVKLFDGCTDMLTNKVGGLEAIPACLYLGESWLDGKPSWIIDYRGVSKLAPRVRDEIREVSPGLYLGIMYRDLGCKRPKFCYFTLDARKPCSCKR